jgi:hypothetical protein
MFSNEDVTIGAWMLAMNVNHENELSLCSSDCSSSSIAVWDIPKCSGLTFFFYKKKIVANPSLFGPNLLSLTYMVNKHEHLCASLALGPTSSNWSSSLCLIMAFL